MAVGQTSRSEGTSVQSAARCTEARGQGQREIWVFTEVVLNHKLVGVLPPLSKTASVKEGGQFSAAMTAPKLTSKIGQSGTEDGQISGLCWQC